MALAIYVGGTGAIFWMWVTAVVGIVTKFFTCSLAVMYRGRDSDGVLQGGPMYVIRETLPRRFRFLTVAQFATAQNAYTLTKAEEGRVKVGQCYRACLTTAGPAAAIAWLDTYWENWRDSAERTDDEWALFLAFLSRSHPYG